MPTNREHCNQFRRSRSNRSAVSLSRVKMVDWLILGQAFLLNKDSKKFNFKCYLMSIHYLYVKFDMFWQRNWVLVTNSNFLIPISLQSHDETGDIKLWIRSRNLSLTYQRFTSSGCKDIGYRNFEFVAKTQFLFLLSKKVYNLFTSMYYVTLQS